MLFNGMGLAKSWTNKQIEPLSDKPLSGLLLTDILAFYIALSKSNRTSNLDLSNEKLNLLLSGKTWAAASSSLRPPGRRSATRRWTPWPSSSWLTPSRWSGTRSSRWPAGTAREPIQCCCQFHVNDVRFHYSGVSWCFLFFSFTSSGYPTAV